MYHLYVSFLSDNIPTIQLAVWDLQACLFDNDIAAGLVPTLFAEDPDTAVANMKVETLKLHGDVMKINRMFLCPEFVTVKEASSILKKPR